MCNGEYVICNDVLGVVINVYPKAIEVENAEGRRFRFKPEDCTSVITPAALARLTFEKVMGIKHV